MGRIRTIKPEFPQSESMGRVSRDARLLFVMLWTSVDDEGRGRGAARMLASTLFPFDDDAKDLIEDWLSELERENCIARYTVEGATYFQIINWSSHQKIDKPTPSRFPSPCGLISENRSERHVELTLYDALERSRTFCSKKIISVQRQVRVGSRYLDIVAKTEDQTFVLEIKKNNITNADLEQVLSYCSLVSGIPVLIGPGISAQFDTVNATKSGAAVVTFDSDLAFSVTLSSEHIKTGDNVLGNVRERSRASTVGPRTKEGTKDQGRDQGEERSAPQADAPPPSHGSGNRKPKGTRWLEGQQVPGEWLVEANAKRSKHGLPYADLRLEAERFANYWASKSGANATKTNWKLTFVNWCLDDSKGAKNSNQTRISPHDKGTLGAAMFLADEARNGYGTGAASDIIPANGHGPAQMDAPVRNVLGGRSAPNDTSPARRLPAISN